MSVGVYVWRCDGHPHIHPLNPYPPPPHTRALPPPPLSAVRLVKPEYYGTDTAMLLQFARLHHQGCTFLVAGRRAEDGAFRTLADVPMPEALQRGVSARVRVRACVCERVSMCVSMCVLAVVCVPMPEALQRGLSVCVCMCVSVRVCVRRWWAAPLPPPPPLRPAPRALETRRPAPFPPPPPPTHPTNTHTSRACVWQGLFGEVPEHEFRADISSTELRASGAWLAPSR